jgi:hypothetical protein
MDYSFYITAITLLASIRIILDLVLSKIILRIEKNAGVDSYETDQQTDERI